MQRNLFGSHKPPLADRMRPQSLLEFVGQRHLLGEEQLFRQAIENDSLGSCIFWGPPGTGKTSLARVIANATNRTFVPFNAVFQGVKDLRQIIDEAKKRISVGSKGTILFVDEIHRFNKAQQDSFLHPIENGTIIVIGATTENPSFELNSALLSRCAVYLLKSLEDEDIGQIIDRTIIKLKKDGIDVFLDDDARKLLINYANGDARVVLNAIEVAVQTMGKAAEKKISVEIVKRAVSSRKVAYDKKGEEHYNLISAFHKSIRGSDPQASLYWLARMTEGGADPIYIARRLVRIASEDIGLADPQALVQALAAKDAVHLIGYPECDAALAQATIYLATAPKSNKVYTAMSFAKRDVAETRNDPVPLHIRNAPTKLMKNLEYGKGYQYDHDHKDSFSGQSFLPDSLGEPEYYSPSQFGFEREIKKRIEYWKELKKIKTFV